MISDYLTIFLWRPHQYSIIIVIIHVHVSVVKAYWTPTITKLHFFVEDTKSAWCTSIWQFFPQCIRLLVEKKNIFSPFSPERYAIIHWNIQKPDLSPQIFYIQRSRRYDTPPHKYGNEPNSNRISNFLHITHNYMYCSIVSNPYRHSRDKKKRDGNTLKCQKTWQFCTCVSCRSPLNFNLYPQFNWQFFSALFAWRIFRKLAVWVAENLPGLWPNWKWTTLNTLINISYQSVVCSM